MDACIEVNGKFYAPRGGPTRQGCSGCVADHDSALCYKLPAYGCPTTWKEVQMTKVPMAQAINELDPTGRDPHAPGAKLDAGKNRLGLVLGGFTRALQEVGRVGTFGANKYTDDGWKSVPNGQARYTDAMYRHLLKEAAGEVNDSDSGLQHAAHAAWNALARLELALIEKERNAAE